MSTPPPNINANLRSILDSSSIDESPSRRGSLDLDSRKFSISVMDIDEEQPYEPPPPPSDHKELLNDLNNDPNNNEVQHALHPNQHQPLRGRVVQQPPPDPGEATPAPGRGAGKRAAYNAAQVGGVSLAVGAVGATATGVSIAAGALKGAAVGAAFGSIVPGIGTGVGAVVGGLIGSAVALGIGGAIAGAMGSGIKSWWKNRQVASVDQPNVLAQQQMPRQQNDNDVGNRLYYGHDNDRINPMHNPRMNIDNNWNDGNLDTLNIDEKEELLGDELDGDQALNNRLDELQKQMDDFNEEDLKVESKKLQFERLQEKHSALSSFRDGRGLERARDDQFGLAYKEHIASRIEIGGNQNQPPNDENPLIDDDAKKAQWNPIPDVTPPSVHGNQQNEQIIDTEFTKADWNAQQTFHKYRKAVPYRNIVSVPNENGNGNQRVNFGFSAHVSGQTINTLHEAYEDAWARQNQPQGGKLGITTAENELLGIGKEQDVSLVNCLAGEEQVLGQDLLDTATHLRDGHTDQTFPPVIPVGQRLPDIARQKLSDCNKQSRALFLLQKAADADFDLDRMSPLTQRYFLRNPNDAHSGPNQTLQTLQQAAQPNANQLMLNPGLAELQNAAPSLKDQITAAQIHNAMLSGIYSGIAKDHDARSNFMAPYHSLKPSQKKHWASFMTRLNTAFKSQGKKGIRGSNGYEYDGIPRSGLFDLRNDLNHDHLDMFMHEMQKDFPNQINDKMRFGYEGSRGAERYDPWYIGAF